MSGHSELDLAIQETKVLQDALLHEAKLHGDCLYELFLAKREIEQWHKHADQLSDQNARLTKELKAERHRCEATDRLYMEQQCEINQLRKDLAAAQVVITTARAMAEDHQQCLNSQLTQRFGRD